MNRTTALGGGALALAAAGMLTVGGNAPLGVTLVITGVVAALLAVASAVEHLR